MNPSNIVRVAAVCAALFVGACGFSPSGQGGPAGSGASSGSGATTGIGNFGGTTSGQGGLTGQGGGMQCGSYDRPSSKLPPDILIVLDASGSMNEDSANVSCNGGCGANSKWALLTPALNQVVMQTETTVNWGLKLFADTNNTCGVGANTAAVPVGANSAAAIAAAIAARTDAAGNVTNGSRTPTRAAENAAVTYLGGLSDPNRKFILMATDGQPNCPASGNSANDDSPGAIAAVAAAATAGYPTFVVGISAPAGAANDALNGMADAGGYARAASDPRYYPVTSAAEFVAVLETLVGVATTCTFSIPPPPTNDGTTSREDIAVTSNTGTIPQDATNGWTYSDSTHTSITLNGSSCAAVEAGTITTVTIVFNCHLT